MEGTHEKNNLRDEKLLGFARNDANRRNHSLHLLKTISLLHTLRFSRDSCSVHYFSIEPSLYSCSYNASRITSFAAGAGLVGKDGAWCYKGCDSE